MSTKTLLTVKQFAELPDEVAQRHELSHGELIEASSGTPKHSRIRDTILFLLRSLAERAGLGIALAETDFQIGADSVHRPDVAFLTLEQWARVDPHKIPIPFAPQLAIEVASASDTVESLFGNVREYLDAGVHTVLVVLSEPFQEVHVFERSGARRLVRAGEILEVPELLPGLSIPVEEIFRS